MSDRTLKQLVGALAVAIGAWVVITLVSGGSGSIAASAELHGVFAGVDRATLDELTVARRGDTVRLERAGTRWSVNGFPADSATVARLLEDVRDVEISELVASNPANHARMGVSADSAAELTLTAAGRTRTILVGDAGRRFGTAYVRAPGDDDVYLLVGDLRPHATRGLEEWRNRTMVSVDTARVARVEIDHPDETFALERGDSTWVVTGGGEAVRSAVNGVLMELARLVASGFVAPSDSLAGLSPASTVRAFDAEGGVLAEITIGEGTGDRWARTASDDYLYRVSSFRAGRVAPSRETVTGGF